MLQEVNLLLEFEINRLSGKTKLFEFNLRITQII